MKTICVVTGVTGASGSVIAAKLQEAGCIVVGTTRLGSEPQTLKKETEDFYLLGLNPLDTPSIQSAIRIIHETLGTINTWVNVIGGFQMGLLVEEADAEHWDRMWQLNFQTVLNVAQSLLPYFKNYDSGRLINFGSAAVSNGMPGAAPYLVSKAAVHALTRAIAAELSGDITCNALLPTIIDTTTNREAMPDADFSSWVSPQRIADEVLRLISSSDNGELIFL